MNKRGDAIVLIGFMGAGKSSVGRTLARMTGLSRFDTDEMVAAACTPKDKLVAYALELGFDSCRIASATTPRHAKEFRSWLGDGAAGEMQWMERGAEKRCDPERVLPGLRSVIVVALNYWQGERHRPCGTGRIARYAWG